MHMNKWTPFVALCAILCIVILVLFLPQKNNNIVAYTGNHFFVPHECKHLALLGCTPHPTHYLANHGNDKELIRNLHIADFLDIAYVTDSYVRTFELCKEREIDHLLIAYLPIYFVRMKSMLGDQFVQYSRLYFKRIIPEITELIKKAQEQTDYQGKTTLIMPTDREMAQVPALVAQKDDRTRYLIKQFPKLQNISNSQLSTITIINNANSQEDDMLIAYLKYEYLFEKPLAYHTASLDKERFHA